MRRGDIYYIARSYQEDGSEQRGNRPAVIVSNDKNNERSGTVEVVYMTTKPKTSLPTHVTIRSASQPSTVLCEQVHTVCKDRVSCKKLGTVTDQELVAIDQALAISLGLNSVNPVGDIVKTYSEMLRVQTERDVYRELYTDLLASLTKGGKA
jgi:mRNA interferase MazF